MNGIMRSPQPMLWLLIAALCHPTPVASSSSPTTTTTISAGASTLSNAGVERAWCANVAGNPHSYLRQHTTGAPLRRRLHELRQLMRTSGVHAYIVTAFDEHLNDELLAERDRRREYVTGFSGTVGDAVITEDALALWTTERYVAQANYELDCEWQIFSTERRGTPNAPLAAHPNITVWLLQQLPADAHVGADPATVPHHLWHRWSTQLNAGKFIRLLRLNRNLIDELWTDRPAANTDAIVVHGLHYAGERYGAKLSAVRQYLRTHEADAMVVTSLTEIAWVLNLRGNDLPYTPVFKAYLIITRRDISLYIDPARISLSVRMHFQTEPCYDDVATACVHVRPYEAIWADLNVYAHRWHRVLVPTPCVFDQGVSEALYTRIPVHLQLHRVSPIVLLRAHKNRVEREGMRSAHIADSAAMCETLAYVEQRHEMGVVQTERDVALETERSRRAHPRNRGLSLPTVVAFGPHGSRPHFEPFNGTDVVVTDQSTLIVESGGQYVDGTTMVTRTIHLGEPSAEQREAYTRVLRGIIRLSMLVFPENLRPSEVDALTRGPVWGQHADYPQATGHGIGAYGGVQESPINVAYAENQRYTFKDGYFFTNEPGFYKADVFGIRLANVLEVVDTAKRHPSGATFLALNDITLVPYEAKLIEPMLLSTQEKRWLNAYNAKIREYVGDELKRHAGDMQAFYWMMNKTRHITEFSTEADYRRHQLGSGAPAAATVTSVLAMCVLLLLVL